MLERRAGNDSGKGPGGAVEVGVEDGVEGSADPFVAALKEVLETVLPHGQLLFPKIGSWSRPRLC